MKLFKRFVAIILCLIIPLILFSGCSDTDEAYIYFKLPFVPETLDPQVAKSDSELLIVKNIFEGLLRKNEEGQIVPGVCKNFSKDGLTYTFNIREDAKWSDGSPLTADDFVFAFRRAVMPKTDAPFASRLFSIVNAEQIHSGSISYEDLGVAAADEKTLKITLNKEDSLFEETLTTSIAMPCRADFFYETKGKYGIFADCLLSNGSYRISRWRKDTFGIRLYKNEQYTGLFKASNAAVFLTCNDADVMTELSKNSIDMAFIDSANTSKAESMGLKTAKTENICWVMTFGNRFTKQMRKALSGVIDASVYENSLPDGFSADCSIFPNGIIKSESIEPLKVTKEEAVKIYFEEISKLEKSRFPNDVILYYYDDGNIKPCVTSIVGTLQSNLSAFVNIESVDDTSLLLPQLTNNTKSMAIFPVKAESSRVYEYLQNFGFTYSGENLSNINTAVCSEYTVLPIAHQNTVIAYTDALSNVVSELGNGYIDFSFIVKTE